MSKLIWDQTGDRLYETGVKFGVLYPQASGLYPKGVAWNGLTGVTESPTGAEATAIYADNVKYLSLMSAEEFGATVEAYTYPDEFSVCDGSGQVGVGLTIGQQTRKSFGLSYRTALGNDVDGVEHGYKIHMIYGAMASPSEKSYKTINDSPEAITLSWEVSTTPVVVTGFKPTANFIVDSTKVDATKLAVLELILYGTTGIDPRLPFPDEIASIFASAAPSALALTTSVPADAGTAVVISSSIVLTFNNKILEEFTVLTSAAGVIIAGAKTWDATGKILTFKPTANLSAATPYLIAVIGAVDVYNQSLAPMVRKFTTA